jgi:hypothetical protein
MFVACSELVCVTSIHVFLHCMSLPDTAEEPTTTGAKRVRIYMFQLLLFENTYSCINSVDH